ncbi:MAG TPA: hypothetical protein VHV51_16860 [Polyangiaceae bacterium]|nr:hypothetical protein [Polyangiaceae bacterium]
MNTLRLGSYLPAAALSALALMLALPARAATTKVACLGEQTTKSNEAPGPMWPALLGTALGANYNVVNDGGDTSGSILTGYDTNGVGADPVMSQTNTAYQDSLTANIVIIGPFGEHDERVVKAFPAMGTEMIFEQDYDALVQSYLSLPSKPTVYITTPIQVPTFDQATQTYVTSVVLPAVQAVAMKHSDVKLVDLYSAFLNHNEFFMGMGDGQTNAVGEVEIEQLVYAAMQMPQNGGGGAGGSGGAGGAGGSAGAGNGGSAGASVAMGGAGAGGASGGSAGASTGAGGSPAITSGGSTSAAGTATSEPVDNSGSNDSGGCSISESRARSGFGWLALAGAFSGLAVARVRRRRVRR